MVYRSFMSLCKYEVSMLNPVAGTTHRRRRRAKHDSLFYIYAKRARKSYEFCQLKQLDNTTRE